MIKNSFIICLITLSLISAKVMAKESYLSPSTVVSDAAGRKLYIAEKTANQIAVFDITSSKVTSNIMLPGSPAGLALSADGRVLYVCTDEPDGKLYKISTVNNKIKSVFSVGHTPSAVAVSHDGKIVYIANRFDNTVSIFNTTTNAIETVDVVREPFDIAVTSDSSKVIVTNLQPKGSAVNSSYISAQVSIINAATKAVSNIILPNGSVLVRGVCVSPDGKFAYITHLLGRYQLPVNQIERGWITTSAMSIIDLQNNALFKTVLLDDLDLGAANPWDITCSPDGDWLYITHAGTDEISLINCAAIHQKLATATNTDRDLGFMAKVGRKRIAVKVKGPRGVTFANDKAWVTGYYSTSIASVDIKATDKAQVKVYSLGTEPKMNAGRKGEMFYNDATLCFQQWLSCASCHPDGRADGLNWDELNDGIGNAKQTKSHLYSHKTPPTTITGCRPDAETSVRTGLAYNYFHVLPEEVATAIDEYLKSLKPVTSPYRVKGKLTKSAKRGKAIFNGAANCSSCHSGEFFTNLKAYNVGTGKGKEVKTKFDTPTLKEIWRTAPYLYDGRAATILEVLTIYNQNDEHGKTSNLTESQIDDLIAYILSL